MEIEQLKKLREGTSGITLIALVVTIVVLVILATVSLNAVIGEKGIINTTQKGRVEQSHQLVWEAMQMEYSTYYAEKIEQKGTMTENFVEYLQGEQIISNDMVDEGYVINVEKLLGGKSSLGNGTDGRNDVYKLEKVNSATAKTTKLASSNTKIKLADEDSDEDKYRVKYYGDSGEKELGVLTDKRENDNSNYISIEKEIGFEEYLKDVIYSYVYQCIYYESMSDGNSLDEEVEELRLKYKPYRDEFVNWLNEENIDKNLFVNSSGETSDWEQNKEVYDKTLNWAFEKIKSELKDKGTTWESATSAVFKFEIVWYNSDNEGIISSETKKLEFNNQKEGWDPQKFIIKAQIPSGATGVAILEEPEAVKPSGKDMLYLDVMKATTSGMTPWYFCEEPRDAAYERNLEEGKVFTFKNVLKIGYTCFTPGTKVLTPTGLVNIEDMKVGDKVYTRNNETEEIEVKEVLKTLVHNYSGNLLKIYTENANVEVTPNHPFYVMNKGWTEAGKLKVGDVLINSNNVEQKITKIETVENNKTIKVYNLLIEDNHDYFVGLDSILVHNKCILAGSQVQIDLKGQTKSIEDIKVGDMVVAYNDKTGKNELRKVTGTYIHKNATDIVTIKFKDGSKLVQNMYHPIYTKEGWKSLSRYEGYEYLENDDVVKTEEGWKEIESIDINLNSKPTDLYTIDVEGLDNFYANGTMIHDNEY